MAVDAARLTRLPGTINSRSGLSVRLLEHHGSLDMYTFEVLAGAILPLSREEAAAARTAREVRRAFKAPGSPRATAHRYNVETLHQARLCDLKALLDGGWGRAVPEGQRNAVIFHMAANLAWLTTPEGLLREAIQLGADVAGWSAAESKACVLAVLGRTKRALRGEPARYCFRNDTIIRDLGITEDEMRTFDLRCLVSKEVARERDAERRRQDRRQAGSLPRNDYLANVRRRRQQALDFSARGLTGAQVGQLMGLSKGATKNAQRPDAQAIAHLRADEGQSGIIRDAENQNQPFAAIQLDLFDMFDPRPWASDHWDGGRASKRVQTDIRIALRASGMTQAKVAAQVRVSRAQLGNVLRGRFGTRPEVAQRLLAWTNEVRERAA